MFIQHTQHSELARNIRERLKVIENVGILKIKLVERTGDKLVDLLHKSNAWGNEDCQRPDCWPCNSAGEDGPKGSCRQRSVMYETYCELCGEKDETTTDEEIKEKENSPKKRKRDSKRIENKRKDFQVKYIGETWRTAYERGNEHKEDVKYLKENSHILKHIIEVHPGKKIEEVNFGMRVIRKFNSALERQVNEAVSIHQAQRDGYILLNSKSEYSRCTVPRLKVETNAELLEKLLGEKESDRLLKERIRSLKKRKKDPLSTICEEIIVENSKKWKKRKLENIVYIRNKEREEKELEDKENERRKRIELAEKKKAELLSKLKKKGELRVFGKSVGWIKKKQQLWRKYRDIVGFNSDDEEEIKREIIDMIPERKPKFDAEISDGKVERVHTISIRNRSPKLRGSKFDSDELSVAQLSPVKLKIKLSSEGLCNVNSEPSDKSNLRGDSETKNSANSRQFHPDGSQDIARGAKYSVTKKTEVELSSSEISLIDRTDPLYTVTLKEIKSMPGNRVNLDTGEKIALKIDLLIVKLSLS